MKERDLQLMDDKETNLSAIKESDLQLGRICEEVNIIRYTIKKKVS